MLGIGKIRPGRETYHLDAVAGGVEDYYFSAHESPGMWMGRGAAELKLEGRVTSEQLLAALAGRHPLTGQPLIEGKAARRGDARLPGYDVTLRAPKSVSLLWALTHDDAVRAEVQAGHDAAVRGSLCHLEDTAAMARRGRNGSVSMPTSGFVAAAFRHRTSRAGDPTLHTHLVLPNVVRGVDGRWSAPDGTRLYANGKSTGYVYQALLRGELSRRLGVAWGPVHNGYADILGTSPEVMRAFSRRRQEIEQHRDQVAAIKAEETRVTAAAAGEATVTPEEVAAEREAALRDAGATTQLSALETRRAKEYSVDMHTAVAEWRDRADRLGYTEEVRQSQLGVQSLLSATPTLQWTMASRLVGEPRVRVGGEAVERDHLSQRASTWSRKDALMGWCSQLRQGAEDLAQLEHLTDGFLQTHPAVIRVAGQGGLRAGDGIRLATGELVPARSDAVRYTTRGMQAMEVALTTAAAARRGDAAAVVSPAAVDDAVRRFAASHEHGLTAGQEAAVRAITSDGHGITVVVGHAGSGKTTALAVARDAWQASGVPVRGVAKAASAARVLELGSGIPTQTIDSLLLELRRGEAPIAPGGVLVVDEAAMTDTPTLSALTTRAEEWRWKLVLVGDDEQLREIDAGGGFRGLRRRLGAVELRDNLRQREGWERDAVALVRRGRGFEAARLYVENGRVAIVDSPQEAHGLMVERWWQRRGESGDELLQAPTNADIHALNSLAHRRRVDIGEVDSQGLMVAEGVEVGVGDRVLTRMRGPGKVINGLRGVVTAVDPEQRRVSFQLDDGTNRTVERGYLDGRTHEGLPALDLAYASTIHKSQGTTVERTQELIEPGLSADAMYVALTRGRTSNELVLIAGERDRQEGTGHWQEEASPRRALDGLVRAIEHAAPKYLSLDIDDQERDEAQRARDRLTEPEQRARQLDRLVATWRHITDGPSDIATAAYQGRDAEQPPTEAIDDDPVLRAIEALLSAPPEDRIDAVEQYKRERRAIAGEAVAEEAAAEQESPSTLSRPAHDDPLVELRRAIEETEQLQRDAVVRREVGDAEPGTSPDTPSPRPRPRGPRL